MDIIDTTPPPVTFAAVAVGGVCLLTQIQPAPVVIKTDVTGQAVNLATGAIITSIADTAPVTPAPNAVLSVFPPA